MAFLPITKEEMVQRGWDQADFVLVTGDAYVDHPSFGAAIISRVLEDEGFRVAVLPQPDWRCDRDFMRFGRPRLAFLVTAGNIDSMVAHYTAAKRKRSDDAYSPGNRAGKRPDRACIVYSRKCKELYPDTPVILGGLEASLRRFAHYDYWDDRVRPSILLEAKADLLTFGMGENQTRQIASKLGQGLPVSSLRDIRGVCYAVKTQDYQPGPAVECPSFERVCSSKRDYAVSCRKQQDEHDAVRGKTVIQRHGDQIVVQNPPMPPLTTQELDRVYALPYERMYHPSYEKEGGVPGIQEVEFSITHNRGCFGACNFCSIAYHQGRAVTVRSQESILAEAKRLTENPRFKVKRVFIRSGIRFDYLIQDKDQEFFQELVRHHVSGQLKVAPEHCSAAVLDAMGKPHIEAYLRFARRFYGITKEAGKEQYLVPYLMSSHPGSTLKDAVELALFLKREKIRPEQVQDFYPTPGTISTCMFYTGLDPYTMKEVYVAKTEKEKAMQRALLQYFNPKNQGLVIEALKKAGRLDLIGTSPGCLVRPDPKTAAALRNKKPAIKKHTVKKGKGSYPKGKKRV